MANRRHPNPRRLEIHRSYTVEQLSAALKAQNDKPATLMAREANAAP